MQSVNTNATVRWKNKIEWKLKLQTTFPYVLSDKIGEEQQKGSDIPIGINFPLLKSNKKHPTS